MFRAPAQSSYAPRSLGTSLLALALLLVFTVTQTAIAQLPPPPAPTYEARLLRFPDIHEDFVVFCYAGDIWRAPLSTGEARRLTSHPGLELFPTISRDGSLIAFSAEYTGTRQVYVMPARGGEPRQLTFYNDVGSLPPRGGWDYWIQDWTPDGKILVRMNRTPFSPRYGRYFLVDPAGGLETPLDPPHGGSATVSPDGKRLAFCPVDREFRTWKHYKGGRAQDIWIYDLEQRQSERLTTYEGTDNYPMWVGDEIFFTSDRETTLNLYSYDLGTKTITQRTQFDGYDVLWPRPGPTSIVFMNGGYLYRYDLSQKTTARIDISIAGDLHLTVPRFEDVSDDIGASGISPSGKRAVFEARGDIFTVPASEGPTRNLTRTQGVRERDPAWSPDGKWVAYYSDSTGDYELYVRAPDSSGEARQLTQDSRAWQFPLAWSPDSSKLAFADRGRRLWILDIESGKAKEIARAEQRDDLQAYDWSPDSRWLVYEKNHPTRIGGIALYSLEQDRSWMLGDGQTPDFAPTFSHDGRHLFFLSNRDFQITFSDFEFNYVYDRATRVFVAALDPEAEPLFAPKSDEEEGPGEDGDTKKGKKKGDDESDDDARKDRDPLRLVANGFVERTVALPGLPAGDYGSLWSVEGAIFYTRRDEDGPGALYRYDLKEQEEAEVLAGVRGYDISADGKKLLYRSGDTWGITDAKAGVSQGDGPLDLSGLAMKLDPRAEWKQIFEDVWRIGRDWFYDENMHGVDWVAMGERYRVLVPHVAHRSDLDFVLSELAGELQAGHAYVQPGDLPEVERVEGAMLGCEFEADDSGFYRIAKIFAGENWDESYRSPLADPGVNVKEGEFLLAIDGEELRTDDNPFRLLENKGHTTVTLTVNDRPRAKGARTVMVRPVTSELNLRYLDWVKSRIALTQELSGGRIGYIHLPNTAGAGNRMLQKLFYSQSSAEALIIDVRYNGGGFIPDRMIEVLSRTTLAYWSRRGVMSQRTPGFAHDGPKAMLINGYAASGGDALPYFFRLAGLGPLIGTRTWGGLVGISGNPMAVDGGGMLLPMFRIYDTEGNWVVENEGVAPDIEVIDRPEEIARGNDPSLAKAVEVLLQKLEEEPTRRLETPVPPDMSP